MTGNRIVFASLILVTAALATGCNQCPTELCDKQLQEQFPIRYDLLGPTVAQAREQGVDYLYTLHLALRCNKVALRTLMQLDGLDQEAAYAHAQVLTTLVDRYGDCGFTCVLDEELESVQEYVALQVRREVARRRCADRVYAGVGTLGCCDAWEGLDGEPKFREIPAGQPGEAYENLGNRHCGGGVDRFCWHSSNHHCILHCPNQCNKYCRLHATYPKLYRLSMFRVSQYTVPDVVGSDSKPGL